MAIIDKTGATRHTMTRAELEHLYKEIERFVADCTRDEYLAYQKEIRGVYTLIHERERTADN